MQTDLLAQIADAHATVATARSQGNEAWQQLETLLDPGSILEYGPLAGETSATADEQHADGLITVLGTVSGSPVTAAAFDATVRNGTQSDRNLRKLARLLYLANSRRWPLVLFLTGAGARPGAPLAPPPILAQARGRFDVLDGLAALSGWAPTVAVVTGRVEDGHIALAMLCDCIIATRDAEFGTAADDSMATTADYAKTGDVDVLADTGVDAVSATRKYLALFGVPETPSAISEQYATIADLVPENRRRPYDMRKVINAFADADSLLELGSDWGKSMLTALARLDGRTVGIFANQPKSPLAGAIDWQAADKAARFVELCDSYCYPLISFVDNPGYMVGPQAEQDGIARHHPRPLSALHHRSVPLATVQVRKAYGLGPYAMSGFGSGRVAPELKLAWPSVESGGMSLEGAAYLVKRKEILAAPTPAEATAIRDAYAEQMRDATSGLRAGRGYMFDDIIAPTDTRSRISLLLRNIPRDIPPHKKHPIDPR